MMSLQSDMHLPKGNKDAEGVAVAAPCVKENDGQSAPKINPNKVTNWAEFQGVTSTVKPYPNTRAKRSAQGAPGGEVFHGPAGDRGPPPGLRSSPGEEYNDDLPSSVGPTLRTLV